MNICSVDLHMSNFIVHGLPRSRTAWLSEFLTYKDHKCQHELSITLRHPKQIVEYFQTENQGASETGSTQAWWLIEHAQPKLKVVLVRRDIEEVIDSLMEVDLSGVAYYERESLRKHLGYSNRMLDKLEKRNNSLSVSFHELNKMETCKKVFEHCLPYEFDIRHWANLKNKNIQVNIKKMIRYYHENKQEITNLKRLCKMELRRLRKTDPNNPIWDKS